MNSPHPDAASAALAEGARSAPYLSVIVPAFNEAGRLNQTLLAMRSFLDRQSYSYEVIVAADGTDGTREAAAVFASGDSRFTVIGAAERGGKGRGVRNGVAIAAGQVIGFIDADYKTPIDEIDKLLPYLSEGYDLAIGSRAVGDSRIERRQPFYRRAGSKVFKGVMQVMVGLYGIGDTQCGFKFFKAAAARDLFSRQRLDGYMFDVEILRLAQRSGYRIREVGVRWADDGDSRYDPVAGTWKNARELLRIRFPRKRPASIPSPGGTQSNENGPLKFRFLGQGF